MKQQQQVKASQHHWALLPFVVGIVVGLSVSTVLLFRPPSTEYVVTNVYITDPAAPEDKKLSDKMQRFEELMRELHPAEAMGTGPKTLAEEVPMKEAVHYSVIMSKKRPPGSGDSMETLKHTWTGDVPQQMVTFYTPTSYQHDEKINSQATQKPPSIVELSAEEPNEIQVLRHVCEHNINVSKWFYMGYDSAYVKAQELEAFLLTFEAFQGQLSYMGRPVQKEGQDTRVCLSGPGSILSYQVLSQLCHRLTECTKMETTEMDSVLGQCVRKLLPDVECSKEERPQQLFLWYNGAKTKTPIIDPRNKEVLGRALTIYPVADHKLMYNIHQLVVGRRLNESQHLAQELKQAVEQMRAFLPQTESKFTRNDNQGVNSREDISSWQLINHDRLMTTDGNNPAMKVPGYWKSEMDSLTSQAIEYLSTVQDRELVFSKLVNAYWRLHPLTGMEYIVDFEAKSPRSEDGNVPPPPSRFCVTLIRPYSPIEISPIQPQVRDSKRVTTVLVMSGAEIDAFEVFMKRLGAVLDGSQGGLNLLVVKMRSEGETGAKKSDAAVEATLHSYERKHLRASFSVVPSQYALSRPHGLALALHEVKPTDILFLADLHLSFNASFLERCRALPLQSQQVYYPIPFTVSGPTPNTSTSLSADWGHWLAKSVDVSCIYAADVLSSVQQEGGKGIPKEVDTEELYKNLLEKGYEVIRSVDSSLWKDQGKKGSCELDFVGEINDPCTLDQDYPYKQLRLRTHLSELLFDHEGKHSDTKF